jgi:hypothetical protein
MLTLSPVRGSAAPAVGPYPCQTARVNGHWQLFATPARYVAYAVDPSRPERVYGVTASTVMVSDSAGCIWDRTLELTATPSADVPLTTSTARLTGVAVLADHSVLVSAHEGQRTRIVGSDNGAAGSWTMRDSGLPPTGAPTSLAGTGHGGRAYAALDSTTGATAGGPLSQPTVGTSRVSQLYVTTDAGRRWALRSGSTAPPAPLTALAVDPVDDETLYGLAGGRLWRSSDSGSTFTELTPTDVTAFVVPRASEVIAFTGSGPQLSADTGQSFRRVSGPAGVQSAAVRPGDRTLMLATRGGGRVQLNRWSATGGAARDVTPAVTLSAPLRVSADHSGEASFYALSGDRLLRYVDTTTPTVATLRGWRVGAISPGGLVRRVSPTGTTTVRYTLAAPSNPVPVDLFYLFDVSEQDKTDTLGQVQTGIARVNRALVAAGLDLAVGLGTTGTSARRGQPPDPPVYPATPGYRQPRLYQRFRAIGPPGPAFDALVRDNLRLETVANDPYPLLRPTGQFIGLDQSATGAGVRTYTYSGDGGTVEQPTYAVAPGQAAGFRGSGAVRRVVLIGTNRPIFYDPAPGTPPFATGIAHLRAQGVEVVGMTYGSQASDRELAAIAAATGARAPATGLDCGAGSAYRLRPGAPAVCTNETNPTTTIVRLLSSYLTVQRLAVDAVAPPGMVAAVAAPALRAVNLGVPVRRTFEVTYGCRGQSSGEHPIGLTVNVHGRLLARTTTTIVCGAPSAAVPITHRDPAVGQRAAPVQPANPQPPPAQIPPAAAPAPAAQFQPQGAAQLQAAAREQERVQLTVATVDNAANPAARGGTQLSAAQRSEGHPEVALASTVCLGGVLFMGGALWRRSTERRQRAVRLSAVRGD